MNIFTSQIAVGVLSAFAVLWAAMQTWSWSRRSGKLAIDPWTLAQLVTRTCGCLAHTFLAVMFFTSLYWFAFFKQQSYLHVLLPSPKDLEPIIKHYIIAIFVLKLVDIVHLLASQMSADVFLLDWERPKPKGGASNNADNPDGSSVSVWRTYLVANEWNELQSVRKINLTLQIILVVFVLKVMLTLKLSNHPII